ncbi:MAG TPA: sugar ABC transporter substrate-binding protein [Trebonia sp.]|nr:sugar ABC transporter substrate-binding protein [Trebonia sp.]
MRRSTRRTSRMWRAPAAAGVAAAVLGLVAAGCSSSPSTSASSGGKTVITFANWADAEQNTAPGIDAAIKEYESLHPDIEIKQEPVSFTDIDHQLLLEAKSGNTPDIAEVQGDYVFDQAATGDLQDLSSYLTSSYKSQVIPSELSLGVVNGQQVAIPWAVAPFALWYNKTLMKEAGLNPVAPATWDQLLADAKAIHAKFPKIDVIGIDSTAREYNVDQDWPIMQSFGGVPFSGKTATATSPAVQDFLTFMRTVDKDGYTPEGQTTGSFRQPAASNQVAFTIDGPFVKGVVQSTNHESDAAFYSTWGVAALPASSPGGTHYSSPEDHQLIMFKSSANKQAAWDFMSWLSTSQWAAVNYTIKYENALPPLASPTGAVAAQLSNPISEAFTKDVIPTVKEPDWGPGYGAAYLDFTAAVQQAMTTSTPISSIASSLQSKLTTDLATAG